ncbi:hypothetical protein [Streptomyces sp. NPDC002133]|uniref:hypothetical protein n=1 Tax=Streptomyces sp. NPDC002133 TaxID=3154409 RepID=UPI00331F33ED
MSQVIGVHAGFVDTDLSTWTDAPKISAADVAKQTLQALANDQDEVLADEETWRNPAREASPVEHRTARTRTARPPAGIAPGQKKE